MLPQSSSSRVAERAYGIMREVEDAHWWFDAMESITTRMLERGGPWTVRNVLDAGCGTGRNLKFLRRHYGAEAAVTGIDYSQVALQHCQARGLARLVRGSVGSLPLRSESFDLLTSFDVLTAGTVDETAAFREMARVLRPGGRLLVRVAAYNFLRSRHDREWDIVRRYRRGELQTKLGQAGLRVLVSSYANTWLFPLALAKRWSESIFPPKEETSDLQIGAGTGLMARGLRTLMASEGRWVAAGWLPCGLSLYALAQKPSGL